MKNTHFRLTEATTSTCVVCGEGIVEGHWFARIRDGQERVLFCRPRCVVRFLDHSAAAMKPELAAGPPRPNGPS